MREIKISVLENNVIINSMIISLDDLEKYKLNHDVTINDFIEQLLSEIKDKE